MKEQVVIKNNLINFYVYNKNNQNNLIFLHGWRSDSLAWTKVINDIQNEKLNIYAIDLPGFGGSSVPNEDFTVSKYAEVIAEFIKAKGLKNVVLVGHSVGGRIAIKLTATNPQLIEKLVLVDSAGFAAEENKTKAYGTIAKIVKPIFKPKAMQGLRTKIYQTIGAEDYVTRPELKQTFLNIINEDLTEFVSKITKKTLLIWGEDDKDTPVAFAEKMHKLIKNSKLVVLKDAGHFSFIDKPDEFINVLRNFIDENN